jgi:hypothetical protein
MVGIMVMAPEEKGVMEVPVGIVMQVKGVTVGPEEIKEEREGQEAVVPFEMGSPDRMALQVISAELHLVHCLGEWLVGLRCFYVRFRAWGENLNAEARSKDLRRGGDSATGRGGDGGKGGDSATGKGGHGGDGGNGPAGGGKGGQGGSGAAGVGNAGKGGSAK